MRKFFLLSLLLIGSLTGCKPKEPTNPPAGTDTGSAPGYPIAIGQIIKQKCLNCHNADNAKYSGGLRLDTWDLLMAGGGVGPDVIPYHLENSVLLQYINTYDDLGLKLQPTMPIDGVPLTHDQVKLFQDWVKSGAPNRDGYVAFSSSPDTRQKIYVTMQGCDLVGVIDAETRMLMRMIEVGKDPNKLNPELPHCVRVDNAGRYAYVCFKKGNFIQKIDTRTDQVVGEINMRLVRRDSLDGPSWEVLTISEDGSQFAVCYNGTTGGIYIVNTATMTLADRIDDPHQMSAPHAIVANAAFDTFYVTSQSGNLVYRVSKAGALKTVYMDGGTNPVSGIYTPHEVILLPGGNAYAVTCQYSHEVRVFDAHTNQLLHVIPVGRYPQEFALSTTKPWLFVTCQEDGENPFPGSIGSVYVIDYRTMQIVKKIYGPFWQPHGIAVDDKGGKVYVVSANQGSGIPSHHASECAGTNGFYHVLDLETLTLTRDTRYEVSAYPYSADVRFKK